MTDNLRLLAAADPAPPSRWPSGPLDSAAEAHLHALVRGDAPARGVRRIVLATAAAGIAATLALVATDGPGMPGTSTPRTPAPVAVQPVAAPAPLAVDPGTPVPSLADLAATAAQRAADSPPSAVRGSHVRAWYLDFGARGEGFPAIVHPEEQLSVPTADGGVVLTRVPADPIRPGQVRLGADRPAPEGAEVSTVGSADLALTPEDRIPPPADPAALAAHLTAVAAPAPADPPELLAALERVLLRWTPGPAEDAAIAGWLARQPGLTALGAVTDRLGRPGVAYALDVIGGGPAGDTRRTVVLDPATGAVLSTELSFLADTGQFAVEPHAVISYVTYGLS
ncbi:hypothetical protein [Geodermatophilus sp. FMUSA9-8]|uniref:hypothetical protein n=1 Tax=Geodermatophilus sp. FMUSA9-8 TaxID=3120155 RepID=UPI00300AFE5A